MSDRLVCRMPARLDTATSTAIREMLLDRVREEGLPVVFDLEDATFVSSMFIRLCLQVSEIAGKGNFRLVNLRPDVKRVFKIAGLDGRFETS